MNTFRRPMFRGGPIDSRGTGITSGLSYAKGGSVNTPKRGLVDGPGGYSGRLKLIEALYKGGKNYGGQGINYLRNLFRGAPSTSKELVPPGYKFADDFLGDFRRNLGVTGGIRDIPGVSPLLNLIARNPKKSLGAGGAFLCRGS